MRAVAPLLAPLLLAALALPAQAQEQAQPGAVITSSGIEDVAVTVYRAPGRGSGAINPRWPRGFAFITETRRVTLPAGLSTLRFEGVAEGLLPETAVVSGLPNGVIEKNRDARLLSPAGLVDAYLKRRVTLQRTNRETGAVREQEAVIQAGPNGGVLLETDQGYEALGCSGLPERMIYPRAPADLSAKPTLSVLVESDAPRSVTVQLLYLAEGFDWAAHYVADRASDGETLALQGWITLANGGVTSFDQAQLNVIAGRLNKQYSPPLPRSTPGALHLQCWPMDITSTHPLWELPAVEGGAPEAMADMARENIVVTGSRFIAPAPPAPPPPPPPPAAEDLGDLKFYRIPFRVDVAAQGQKQIALLAREGVAVEPLYVGTLSAHNGDAPLAATIRLRMQNREEDGLGLPLPGGSAAVFETVGGQRLLLGEAEIGDKAKGERVDYDIGASPAVRYRLRERPGGGTKYRHWQVEITNARPVDADVEMLVSMRIHRAPRNWERRGNAWVWGLRVPAHGKIEAELRERIDGR
ncbi:DUF4139 domain-containing protein [Sphingopyxis sp. MWB1]|uniref:DUF4139 domain-containing protein n=1 Tax=Sphingopyxis sp. MWB1 TaxID=1537715 RepID=UPI00051A4C23|nr:hypothetical protein [Sphingopyxis sp. MWB1]